jgi:hypothetical protein
MLLLMAKRVEGRRERIYWPFPSSNAVSTGTALPRLYRWILNSALLGTFGSIERIADSLHVGFVQTSELCKERGKVGGIKQRFLAKFNAPEVAPFDGSVE